MNPAGLQIGKRVVVEPDHLVGFVAAILFSRGTEGVVIGPEVESVSGRQCFLPLALAVSATRAGRVKRPQA